MYGVLYVQQQHTGKEPGGAGGQKICAVFALEPACKADVVGVVVGDKDAGDRFARKRSCQEIVPDGPDAPRVEPGVDQRPAVAVIERVDIDVVQRHWQR